MGVSFRQLFLRLGVVALLCISGSIAISHAKSSRSVEVSIATIDKRVLELFKRDKITLHTAEVDIIRGLTRHVYHVSLPYDPQSEATEKYYYELYGELGEYLNYSAFTLVDSENDLRVEVTWKNKIAVVDFVALR